MGNILYVNGNNSPLVPIMGINVHIRVIKYSVLGNILYINGNNLLLVPIMGIQITHQWVKYYIIININRILHNFSIRLNQFQVFKCY